MSSYGWTYLSRDALRRAEHQLSSSGEGVRDEIGFLTIHQRYADFFFPGTSVLHTRLRYALFVPWLYQSLHARGVRGRPQDALQREEIKLAGRLKEAAGGGAIGGFNFPDPTSQPASLVYWTALGTWGLLREREARLPSRAALLALLQSRNKKTLDDDGTPLVASELPFAALPVPPDEWHESTPLGFDLLPKEAIYLHRQITSLSSRRALGQRCLLARLAAGTSLQTDDCWAPSVIELAGDDRAILQRAGHVASLAAVGRAVYAALVETLRQEEDHQITASNHRNYLPEIIEAHAAIAERVKLTELMDDMNGLSPALEDVLRETLAWLKDGAKNVITLRDVYEHAEYNRKHQRARLSRFTGASRRVDWDSERHALAEPLHYRWRNVSRLLNDLWAAA